ncbi:glycosyltransferase [Vibrio parahaemolyticus]|uniref:glycosyltransferase family 2 protein n=1 Tax=Vibrio harveyi group TaxID=717610 RepID=UPI000870F710|nr:glycosyltransferase family A protein [Vibrio parahaemolyticus]AOV91151.1 hypothetical protein FORC23_2608 [Vibrio parahaemolyticus]EGR2219462.1 glycosyltransferase family 2 protein [Vibrio parahaemolyticus]EJG0983018.1 glycosyltransferase [Vibrio parahaemolyticus]
MVKLSIGISTVESNRDQAVKLSKEIVELDKKGFVDSVSILSQFENSNSCESITEKISLHRSTSKGLSNSRNDLLDILDGDFFWLLDDDVVLNESLLHSIEAACQTNCDQDILVGKIYCSDKGEYFKDYKSERKGYRGVLSVSSIEMILKKDFLRSNGIKFNTSLGLGAKYPCGEENDFLIRCLNLGARIKFFDKVFVLHPSIASLGKSDYFSDKYQVRAKKIIAKSLPYKYRLLYMCKVYIYLVFFKKDLPLAYDLFNSDL